MGLIQCPICKKYYNPDMEGGYGISQTDCSQECARFEWLGWKLQSSISKEGDE